LDLPSAELFPFIERSIIYHRTGNYHEMRAVYEAPRNRLPVRSIAGPGFICRQIIAD